MPASSSRPACRGPRRGSGSPGSVTGALELAQAHGVEMPIADQVRAVVFDHLPPMAAVAELMSRSTKDELEPAHDRGG